VITSEEQRDLTLYDYRERQARYAAGVRRVISAKQIMRTVSFWGEFPEPNFDSLFDDQE
jgi:hypothetical protein